MSALPTGVAQAATLTSALDRILGEGLARLNPAQQDELQSLAANFAGSPLGESVSQAVASLSQGELLSHHLVALAMARASLEGARHDALLAQAASEQGLKMISPELESLSEPEDEARVRMDAMQQWLTEIALAGLCQLDSSTIAPVLATLEGVQARPELGGLAAMATGFATELLEHAPTASLQDPPLRRWGDLWSRCMLATVALPERAQSLTVSGELRVLGADIRHHDHVLSLVIHGLLHQGEDKRLVRCTLTAWKVDAIAGPEIWTLVRPMAPELIDALAKPKVLQIEGMVLRGGDLIWDGPVTVGAAFDPFKVDLSGAVLVPATPRMRHPVQIAIPAIFNGVKGHGGVLDQVAVDLTRVSPHSDLEPEEVDKSTELIVLRRFDTDWSWQPLAGKAGRKVFGPAQGIAAGAKVKKPALGILKERASKLLRGS